MLGLESIKYVATNEALRDIHEKSVKAVLNGEDTIDIPPAYLSFDLVKKELDKSGYSIKYYCIKTAEGTTVTRMYLPSEKAKETEVEKAIKNISDIWKNLSVDERAVLAKLIAGLKK